ncbi:MAG: ABC transporter permease [Nevskia sp.]|nr:ABC transporter permease [Nevskia sp.]
MGAQAAKTARTGELQAAPRWTLRKQDGVAELALSGEWTMEARLSGIPEAAAAQIELEPGQKLRIDACDVSRWDSALPAFLLALAEYCRNQGWTMDAGRLPTGLRTVLKMADELSPPASARPPVPVPVLRRVGERTVGYAAKGAESMGLLGEVVVAMGQLLRGRAVYYKADVWGVFQACGAEALPIVGLVNVLVGAIIAFVGAVQLLQFGAAELLADGVAIATVREMAAVITAVVLSGRTGAAFAAQIATMQGNEEIDALRVMGVPVVEFLVLPRVLALTLMTPLLYLYACLLGMFGGFLVGTGMLDLSLAIFLERTRDALNIHHFLLGFSKSFVFGGLVALSGCYYGLRAGRNAAAVVEATTSAVVAGIVGVIVVDAVFAVCAYALGI